MKYYTFFRSQFHNAGIPIVDIKIRKWDITLQGEKTYEWIFVNMYGSKPIMPDVAKFLVDDEKEDNLFVVSPKVKSILEAYNLAFCTFKPINVYWEDNIRKRYKMDDTPFVYYTLNVDEESCAKAINFEKSLFAFVGNDIAYNYDINYLQQVPTFTLKNYEELYDTYFNVNFKNINKYIIPVKYVIDNEYDCFMLPFKQFVFNEHIKDVLFHFGITNVTEYSIQNSNLTLEYIEIPEAETKEHTLKANTIFNQLKENLSDRENFEHTNIIDKETQKRDRLLQSKGLVAQYVKENNIKANSEIEQQLLSKEIELDIILPEKYKNKILLKKKIKIPKGYDLLPIERITPLGIGEGFWHETTPYAVKSVGIAENGCGDYLGYLLKDDSDIFLDDTLYEFLHESGTLIPI